MRELVGRDGHGSRGGRGIRRSFPVAAVLLGIFALCPVVQDAAARPQIIVSAAASLTDALQEIKARFLKEQPDWDIVLNLGAAGALQLQIEMGAPADVFAAAGMPPMKALVAKGLVDSADVRVFARNQLVLIVPDDGRTPADSSSENGSRLEAPQASDADLIRDLQNPRLHRIAVGDEATVSAGRYAAQTLRRLGVFEQVKGKLVPAQDVRQVLEYVATGSVDAGFLFATDVKPGAGVLVIGRVPDGLHDPILYPIAPLKNSEQPRKALAFVQFVLSPQGQEILQMRGFLRPAPAGKK